MKTNIAPIAVLGWMPMSKYHSKKIQADGQTFDSRKEYGRWCALRLMERAGEITDLRRQVKYVLIPAQYGPDTVGPRGGVKRGPLLERERTYIADFVYIKDGQTIVEDCKGFKTDTYKLKRALMLYKYGIRILET